MARYTRAAQALLFMKQCRYPLHSKKPFVSIRHASDISQYSPSNFTRPLPSQNPRNSENDKTLSAIQRGNRAKLESHTLPGPRPVYAHPISRPPPPQDIAGVKLTFWIWFKMRFGWRPRPLYKPAPIHISNNPYRARKKWPPDFRDLDPKQQFHFEKTYRRRAAMAYTRPAWNKSIKILQQTLITITLVYFIFIAEPKNGEGTPFDGVCFIFLQCIDLHGMQMLTLLRQC